MVVSDAESHAKNRRNSCLRDVRTILRWMPESSCAQRSTMRRHSGCRIVPAHAAIDGDHVRLSGLPAVARRISARSQLVALPPFFGVATIRFLLSGLACAMKRIDRVCATIPQSRKRFDGVLDGDGRIV